MATSTGDIPVMQVALAAVNSAVPNAAFPSPDVVNGNVSSRVPIVTVIA
ncbi:hypothetical protein [Flexivirga lutea]